MIVTVTTMERTQDTHHDARLTVLHLLEDLCHGLVREKVPGGGVAGQQQRRHPHLPHPHTWRREVTGNVLFLTSIKQFTVNHCSSTPPSPDWCQKLNLFPTKQMIGLKPVTSGWAGTIGGKVCNQ